ncbi:MAG: sigma-54-dependent Fis family transcriptional regulator [bacterium]
MARVTLMLIKHAVPKSHRFDAWEAFARGGALLPSSPPRVATSWQRCREANLDPRGINISEVASEQELARFIRTCAPLAEVSRSSLEILEKSLSKLSHAILLSDREGNILYQSGAGRVLEGFVETGLVAGGNCSEVVLGSTAPGIVLIDHKPIILIQEEHYSQIYHWFCCTAAPIFDLSGRLRGCLDVTTSYERAESVRLALGLTMTAARSIQSNLHVQQLLNQMEEARQVLDCTSGLTPNPIVVLDRTGRILHANQSAADLFRKPLAELVGAHYGQSMESEDLALCLSGQKPANAPFRVRRLGGEDRRLIARSIPLQERGAGSLAAMLVFEEERRAWSPSPKASCGMTPYTFGDIRGKSAPIRRAIQLAQRFAATDLPILLEGETGTGKEMFAQAIHNQSLRKDGPFVPINCAAIPRELVESELFGYQRGAFTGASKDGKKGKFEQADGGTIFLDEINSMSSGLQAKLLRVLENGEIVRLGDHEYKHINVRIIAASSTFLEEQRKEIGFRQDLLYRLNIVRIRLPALRERMEDLEELTPHFLKKSARKSGAKVSKVHPDVLDRFRVHTWPGNIRELENCIEFALHLCEGETLLPEHLPDHILRLPPAGAALAPQLDRIARTEKSLLLEALESARGNIGEAAQRLGMSRSTMYRRRKRYGVCRPSGRKPEKS